MPRALLNGVVVAESDRCEIVDGNLYFPPNSLRRTHLRESATRTVCSWKGEASYYDVVVGDTVLKDAAWHYPAPKEAAASIKDHVAFWRGVTIEG